MLGKLMKHEFKATGRILLPFYAGLILLSLVSTLLYRGAMAAGDNSTTFLNIGIVLVTTLLVTLTITIFVLTFVLAIYRFYKNLFCDEGYLMNTLPVSTHANITSKLLVSTLWQIGSCIIAFCAGAIIVFGLFPTNFFTALREGIALLQKYAGPEFWQFLTEFGLAMLLGIINGFLTLYASLAIGCSFAQHKVLYSIVAYICIYVAGNILSTLILTVTQLTGIIDMFQANAISGPFHNLMWLTIGLTLLYSAAFYIVTYFFMNKKLNLQ